MPEPTDPFDRLGRLAPVVDTDAATAAFAHRRTGRARRRRAFTGGAVAAALLLLGGMAVMARPGGDGEQVLAGSTTVAPSSEVRPVPEGLEQGERRTSTEDHGLAVSMDTPETATVGERFWVDLELTNRRSDAVTVGTVAPCAEPLGALAGPLDAVRAVDADTGVGAFSVDPPAGSGLDGTVWSGDLADLPAVLGGAMFPKVHPGRDESQVTVTSTACPSVLLPPETIQPGASISRRVAIDLRWVSPDSAEGDQLEVLGSTGALTAADGTQLGRITVRQPTTLRDPVARQASYDAARSPDGIATAPTFPEWLVMTGEIGAGLTQTYSAEMTWWNGAWEAWVLPGRGSGHQADPLRIRFDPVRNEVVDVRTVFGNRAPSDDPDQPTPTEAVEDVRYRAS